VCADTTSSHGMGERAMCKMQHAAQTHNIRNTTCLTLMRADTTCRATAQTSTSSRRRSSRSRATTLASGWYAPPAARAPYRALVARGARTYVIIARCRRCSSAHRRTRRRRSNSRSIIAGIRRASGRRRARTGATRSASSASISSRRSSRCAAGLLLTAQVTVYLFP
jgi:hypothetical protein